MSTTPLSEAIDPSRFGAKTARLGRALGAGLPVPAGIALSCELMADIGADRAAASSVAGEVLDALGGPLAVRSSAIGEDSGTTSFAGQHTTVLNVCSFDGLRRAFADVASSAHDESAEAYRSRMGVAAPALMGVLVQELVPAAVAGVLFTREPLGGADERVIEASWGLGEAVVQGAVVPDRYRLDRSGSVVEQVPGIKDVAVRPLPGGGTTTTELPDERACRPCLDDELLVALHELACRCEDLFGEGLDIEWAATEGSLSLLQVRPITVGP